MKKLIALLSLVLCLCLLAGCAGTPVIYHINCDCPDGGTNNGGNNNGGNNNGNNGGNNGNGDTDDGRKYNYCDSSVSEGNLKTGIALVTSIKDSFNATADANGEGKYDVTMVAVLVDDAGVIRACIIDGIATSVKFDTAGQITSDLSTAPQTKNELGENYGMVAGGGAIAEWDAQAKALADFAIDKTVTELKNGAIDETGKAPAGSDLASSATIYLGGYVSAIEKAVANAKHLGAQGGDQLKLASNAAIKDSTNATADAKGLSQLDVDSVALTVKDGVITSCAIDSVQAKVNFDATGAVTSDLTAAPQTKNELGASYGMVAWGGAIAEWDAQATAFAAYVTGKTPAQVAGIAITNTTKPSDRSDLATSVTIAIGGFQALVAKATK